ncbi:MAG: CrcB family protein [Rhodobacteraceae bacterium]|nr:CrcB family protein [Paracoccaceae bacterium]
MVWVAFGAGLGAGLRAALAVALPLAGSLGANAAGSLLIGFLAALPLSARMRAFAMTGFCGGFTTFSLFGFEVITLLQADAVAFAAFYVATTLALSLGGVALGLWVGRRLVRRRA